VEGGFGTAGNDRQNGRGKRPKRELPEIPMTRRRRKLESRRREKDPKEKQVLLTNSIFPNLRKK